MWGLRASVAGSIELKSTGLEGSFEAGERLMERLWFEGFGCRV